MWLQSSGSFLSRNSQRIRDGNRKDLKSCEPFIGLVIRASRVSDSERFAANQPGLFSAGNARWWEPLQIKMMHDCRLREFQSVWHYSSAARRFPTSSRLEAARQEVLFLAAAPVQLQSHDDNDIPHLRSEVCVCVCVREREREREFSARTQLKHVGGRISWPSPALVNDNSCIERDVTPDKLISRC